MGNPVQLSNGTNVSVGTERDADRVAEAYVKDGPDGAARACGRIPGADAASCERVAKALQDGQLQQPERVDLRKNFSIPFVYRLATDGDTLRRRAARLADQAKGTMWSRPSADESLKMLSELQHLRSPASALAIASILYRHDDDDRVHAAAQGALLAQGPDVHQPLLGAMKDNRPGVRAAAATALAHLGTPYTRESIPALTSALKDPSDIVQEHAARGLGLLGERAKGAVPSLVEMVKTNAGDDGRTAAAAAMALARIDPKHPEAMPTLLKALDSPFWRVRLAAVEALGTGVFPATKEATAGLKALMKHGHNAYVREIAMTAAWALGEMRAEAAVPELTDALYSLRLRSAAAEALGKIGPAAKAAVPLLVNRLSDDDAETRAAAAWALGRIGAPARDAVAALRVLASNDDRKNVRDAAAQALKQIQQS